MSPLGGIVQLKSIAIEEQPVGRLHWSAFSSQRDWVWQLTRFADRKRRSGVNRISHPDWMKLSVELNCAPNQNTKFFSSLQIHDPVKVLIREIEHWKATIQKHHRISICLQKKNGLFLKFQMLKLLVIPLKKPESN